MRFVMPASLLRCAALASLLFHGAPAAWAQSEAVAGERALEAARLVVMVRAHFDPPASPEYGAGVIVGVRDDSLYIATANHLLTQLPEGADEPMEAAAVTVWFHDDRSYRQATVLGRYSGVDDDDVSVLRVALPRGADADRVLPRWDRLGDSSPQALNSASGSAVYIMGYPGEQQWEGNGPEAPHALRAERGGVITFCTGGETLDGGFSGGGLFDARWGLIGVVRDTGAERCPGVTSTNDRGSAATNISVVRRRFYEWGYPWSLEEQRVCSSADYLHPGACQGSAALRWGYRGSLAIGAASLVTFIASASAGSRAYGEEVDRYSTVRDVSLAATVTSTVVFVGSVVLNALFVRAHR